MASDPHLVVRDLILRKGEALLLDKVSLSLERGRFHALLGPNGAGKSSLLRILYRAERASSGTVSLSGRSIEAWPRRDYAARVGALVQEAVTLAGLTLIETVRLGLLPLRLTGAEAESRCREALDLAGLGSLAEAEAARLSGGERQRLFFAQLLAVDPDVYLLDEPHNHLDLHYQYRLLDIVRARGKTVLASFHDLTLATRYCDTAFLVDHGRLAAEGSLEHVLTRARLAQVYRIDAAYEGGTVTINGAMDGPVTPRSA